VASRVLITGISGFTGPYLRAALEARNHHVVGIAERGGDKRLDLLDEQAVDRFFAVNPFDYVVHLAAISFVAHNRAADYYRVNVLGTAYLLEALLRHQPSIKKVIIASSANVYGRPGRLPADESLPLAPTSHYGVSKVATELMAQQWFGRLPILVTRPFNYTGVGQASKFVLAKVVGAFRDRAEELELGDTSVVREFMDVRDVAEVYARLLGGAAAGEIVNVCSGKGYRLDHVLGRLSSLTGQTIGIQRAESLLRGNEIPELVGSPRKLESMLGGNLLFRPLDETLRWMLEA